jgi:hypothetical protein
MPTTISRRDRLAEVLDILSWVRDGRVRSDATDGSNDIWLKRADHNPRLITDEFQAVADTNLVERVGPAMWRLTGEGRSFLDTALTVAEASR